MQELTSLDMLLSTSEPPLWQSNLRCPSAARLLRFLLLAIFACSPIHSFTLHILPSSRRTQLCSVVDDHHRNNSSDSTPIDPASSTQQAVDQERKIRAAYFLQSSGFAPSNSTISFLLGGNDESTTASWAKESMASLEQSYRQSLLSQITNQSALDPECQEYMKSLSNSWKEEWDFREAAFEMAQSRARAKQEERLQASISMMRQRDELMRAQNTPVDYRIKSFSWRRDGQPGFGMPYGKLRRTSTTVDTNEVEEVVLPKVEKNLRTDAPILGRIMEEAEQQAAKDAAIVNSTIHDVVAESTEKPVAVTTPAHDIEENTLDNDGYEKTILNENTTISSESDKQSTDVPDMDLDEEPSPETNDLEIAAAAQRAAAAKAAQAKADERARLKRDAAIKKRQEAKALAEAIMKHAEEEERLRIEKEQAEAELRRLVEEEAARWRAEEEERARLQAVEEEKAARLRAEEKERAKLKADEKKRL
eukprot:CCRYP_014267-RA/>CCRYP_014267-RA protein AED:0.06 eAED:0.06 QI:277/1/1/1/0/0/2/1618/477